MMTYVVALLCVVGLAAGQILFKVSAVAIDQTGSYFSFKGLVALFSAMLLYAATSLAWVWVLQNVELGRIYPLMALAFILVPIGSYLVFGERFPPQYYLGIGLIVAGIIVAVKS